MKKTALLAVAVASAGLGLANAVTALAYSPCGRGTFGPTCVGQVYVAPTPSTPTRTVGAAPVTAPSTAPAPAPRTSAPAMQPTFAITPVVAAPVDTLVVVSSLSTIDPLPIADPFYLTPKTGVF